MPSLNRCAAAGSLPATFCLLASLASGPVRAADPTVEEALKYAPVQKGVEYDIPTPEEAKACRIERAGDGNGWTVRGVDGAILRQYVDSNADKFVDTWSYFRGGVEVYRDIDADFDRKADQYRWFQTGGSRWGVDRNEDGVIDSWRAISAEEAAEEVVLALRTKDAARFARLLLTPEEVGQLGLPKPLAEQLTQRLVAARKAFEALVKEGKIDAAAEFTDFGGQRPGTVPAGARGITKDLLVYEDVYCMVRTGDADQHQQLQIGGLVAVGPAWRLIDGPVLGVGDQAVAGFFYDAQGVAPPENAVAALNEPTEEMQQILEAIQKIDEQFAAATDDKKPALNAQRADLLERLAGVSTGPGEKELWLKQLADMISSHVQDGTYPTGLERLAALEERLRKEKAAEELIAHVEFRRMQAAWGLSLADPKADYAKIQEAWLKQLEEFVAKYKTGENVAEALYQLAMGNEYPPGEPEQAQKWYQRLIAEFPQSANAARARGALRRLTSVGKAMTLKGPALQGGAVDLAQYRGRVVLIHYWSSSVPTAQADHKALLELYAKYGGRKFEVIGVNLDGTQQEAVAYLRQNKLPWKQLYEPGGLLDSRLAAEMGIMQVPQMILVDAKGAVVNTNILTAELADALQELIPSEVAANGRR